MWVRFGRYEALLRLGAGGMAEVFAARLTGEGGFHKLVAIKRMLPHLADDAELVERFFDEARIAANIVSPHVVRTLDVGRGEDGAPYIVMELIVGVTLTDLFYEQRGGAPPLPLPVVIELLAQVADGLADAHAARTPDGRDLGIVHRDVSPQNVLVGADGRARLTDFGIARALDRQARTATGRVFGKLAYMAPEQMRGERVTARSDVFALGVVAWEVISGRRLYGADERDDRPAPRLDRMREGVPEAVVAVVAHALERDPKARCPSAAELGRGLRRGAHALGQAPDAATLARYVAQTGGRALAEVHRRIALATAPEDARDVTRTGAVAGADADDPETAVTAPDTTLEIVELDGESHTTIDVDATIVSDALDGAVNVSGEQTWSTGGTRAVDVGVERTGSPESGRTVVDPRARDLHAAATAPLDVRTVATTVDPPRRSLPARMLVPIALVLLVAGIGIGAWVGLRDDPGSPDATASGDGWIAVPLAPHAATGGDLAESDGAESAGSESPTEDEPAGSGEVPERDARAGDTEASTDAAEREDDDAREDTRRSRRPRRRVARPESAEETAMERAVQPGMLLGGDRYPEGTP